MNPNPVGWFEIYVDDMARARRFYETVFAGTLQPLGGPEVEMWAFPGAPGAAGASGALVKMDGYGAGHNSVIVYFHTDDCAVEASRIDAAGGKLHKAKFSIGPYGFIALGTDTEGNMIGIHSMA